MRADRMFPQPVMILRRGVPVQDPQTGLMSATPAEIATTAQVEPWRPDGTVPRPEPLTSETSRVFVAREMVRGAGVDGEPPDEIAWGGNTWRVIEVIAAPPVGRILAAWHAHAALIQPLDVVTPPEPEP